MGLNVIEKKNDKIMKKWKTHYTGISLLLDMCVEEIESEVEQLRHQINGLRGRCSLVTDTVTQLESKYELSKNFAPPKRYDLMKKMVQKVVNDQFIWCNAEHFSLRPWSLQSNWSHNGKKRMWQKP